MRTLKNLLICGLLLTLSACGSKKEEGGPGGSEPGKPGEPAGKPQELIVGKWVGDYDIEYLKDGTIVLSAAGIETGKGKYTFVKDDVIEVQFGADAAKQKKTLHVTKDELVTKDETGKEEKFQRPGAATAIKGLNAKELIVGKWAGEKDIEFKKDGTFSVSAAGIETSKGKYNFISENQMELESQPGGTKEDLIIVSITKDELVTKTDGKEETYKRPK